jgi:hypothetical protein
LKTFHTASTKEINPCNQKLPGSENLRKIHNIKGSCSDCDGDHELEQGFHLQLEMHGVHDEEQVTDSDS